MSPPADKPNEIELIVVVNGTETTLRANVHEPLHAIIGPALAATHNEGQPPENWEIRDASGVLLPLDTKVEDFHFAPDATLFLNLKAGVGGE